MSPVYEEDGLWWFIDGDYIQGPYTTESLALQAYQKYGKNNCPTCEE